MMSCAAFAELSSESEQLPDDQKNTELPAGKSRASFEWPPDCLWPFADQGDNVISKILHRPTIPESQPQSKKSVKQAPTMQV
jgi:hypothetical protein